MNDLSPRAQRLLEAGRGDLEPTVADQARVREILRHRLAVIAPNEPPPVPKPVEAGAPWPVISGLTVGAGVLAGALYLALSTGHVPETASHPPVKTAAVASSSIAASPAASAPATVAPAAADPPLAPATRIAPGPSSPEASRSQGEKPRDATRLGEEVDLLSRATSALHAGRASEALAILAEHQQQFPRGALALERRAARAQALCQLGRKSEAYSELAHLPASSPQAGRAREACDD